MALIPEKRPTSYNSMVAPPRLLLMFHMLMLRLLSSGY
jgi:hypothetical protein